MGERYVSDFQYFILSFDKTYYLTSHPLRAYNILNSNRVFDIKQIAEGVNYFAKEQQ